MVEQLLFCSWGRTQRWAWHASGAQARTHQNALASPARVAKFDFSAFFPTDFRIKERLLAVYVMMHGIVTSRHSCLMLIFIVVLHLESVLTTCMEGNNQLQRYLISSEPPYDNYYNISKAVYPSVAPPSLLIDITVAFLAAAYSNGTQRGPFPNNNGSTAGMNSSKQNGSDSRPAGANTTWTYKWSMSCLYVSGGNISLSSMNIFSLWAIWPNRRKRELYITLPQFCSGSPGDPPHHDAMLYFLSTVWSY